MHRAHKQGVAVGRSLGRDARTERAAGAAAVVDHHLAAGELGKLRRQRPGKRIGATTGRKRDHQIDRLGGPGRLRLAAQTEAGRSGSRVAQQGAA
jgi:hypothetical protein